MKVEEQANESDRAAASEESGCENDNPINNEQKKFLDEMNDLFEAQLSKNKNVNKESVLKKRELF